MLYLLVHELFECAFMPSKSLLILYSIDQAKLQIKKGNSHFDTPRLLHLYDGEGPPLEEGSFPKNSASSREFSSSHHEIVVRAANQPGCNPLLRGGAAPN
jgi:hypothetical protein